MHEPPISEPVSQPLAGRTAERRPGSPQPDPGTPDASAREAIARVFHLYDPPLWLVTARAGERRGGCIATFVVRSSIVHELPRMTLGLAKRNYTWELVRTSGRFALQLIPQSDLEAVWRFALASGHETDKLEGLESQETPDGNPLYPGAAAWLDCRVETELDIGDRTVFVAAVGGGAALRDGPVLGVATLLQEAPPERRAELDRLYTADREEDARAIRAWRRTRGQSPDPEGPSREAGTPPGEPDHADPGAESPGC